MRASSQLKRRGAWAALLALLLTGVAIVSPAAAMIYPQIHGIVTTETTSGPIEGVTVCATNTATLNGGCTETDAFGGYRFEGLEVGEYHVDFWDSSGDHLPEYYDDSTTWASAQAVVVGDPSTTAPVIVNAALAPAGAITGRVTSDSTGDPVSDVEVCATPEHGGGFHCAVPSADGTYRIGGLPAGLHRVAFAGSAYVTEYYDDASWADADLVDVSPGSASTGIDAALGQPATISGSVTSDATGAPIVGALVCAEPGGDDLSSCSYTNVDGSYLIPGLFPGQYRLWFSAMDGDHLSEYHDDASWAEAQLVTVSSGDALTGYDAGLALGGAIAGAVVGEAGGEPLAGVQVCAYMSADSSLACSVTDSDGQYRIGPLRPGSHLVNFNHDEHLMEFFDDAPDFDSATPVAVQAGLTTTVGAGLAPGGSVAGTVTSDVDGSPLPGITVCSQRSDFSWLTCAVTDGEGAYRLAGLPAGDHYVGFTDSTKAFTSELYDDAADYASATTLTIGAGSSVSEIDAALAPSAWVSGTVTEVTTNAPLGGVEVCATPDSPGGGQCTSSNEDGSYLVGPLAAGDHRVVFRSPHGHVAEYHLDTTDWSAATLLPVTAGSTTTGIDAELAMGGSVRGIVSDAETGAGLAGIDVCAWGTGGGCSSTDAAGTYTVAGLETGAYVVIFTDPDQEYVNETYDDVPGYGEGTPVPVTLGAATDGVDAALDRGGAISGTVVAEDGATPLENLQVCASPLAAGPSHCARTAPDGTYRVAGLVAGDHRVRFGNWDDDYIDEYHDDTTDEHVAVAVPVGRGAETPGIDAAIARGWSISGAIVGPGAGQTRGRAVGVYTLDGTWLQDLLSPEGSYTARGLAPGYYKVALHEYLPDRGPITQWYGGGTDPASAQVVVLAGSDVEGIDLYSTAVGTISGTVYDSTGAPAGGGTARLIDVATFLPSASTDIDQTTGGYEFAAVAPGRYLVVAEVAGRSAQAHTDGSGSPEVVEITEAAAVRENVDVHLPGGGGVAGQLSGPGGVAIDGTQAVIELWAADDLWLPSYSVGASADGTYTLQGVAAGTYVLRASSDEPGTRPTWFGGPGDSRAAASPIAISDDLLGEVDIELLGASTVGVEVTEGDGGPIPEPVRVSLYRTDATWWATYTTVIDGSSPAVFADVVPGDYQVNVSPLVGGRLSSRWYGGTSSRATAEVVAVGEGGRIDVSVAVPTATVISGAVVRNGALVPGATVKAFSDGSGFFPDAVVTTLADGRFEVRGLAPGTYRLHVSDPSSMSSGWLGGADRWTARQIVVAEGHAVRGLVADLSPG